MNRQDEIRLCHMLDAARDAVSFILDRTRDDLDEDRMLVLSLIKSLELIGEAASQVSEETRKQYQMIPWNVIIGMRNRLIHVYFDIDLDVVWKTVKEDIPFLIKKLTDIDG